jgi:hypothetical protein
MKTYLETYVTDANLTDENGDEVSWRAIFSEPPTRIYDYYLRRNVDLVLAVAVPRIEPLLNSDQEPYGYIFHIPVTAWCVDKYDNKGVLQVRGATLKWTAELEVRNVLASYPTGSQYGLEDARQVDVELGAEKLYGVELTINYKRSTTA